MIKVKENPTLVRDEHSKAVLNNDVELLKEFKNKKLFFSALNSRMDLLEEKVNTLTELVKKIETQNRV